MTRLTQLIALSVLLAVTPASNSSANFVNADHPGEIYDLDPVVGLATAKNKLVFIWSAESASATAYQDIIIPLASAVDTGQLEIMMLQVPVSAGKATDTDLILSCAPRVQYPYLIGTFLKNFTAKNYRSNGHNINSTLYSMGGRFGLPNRLDDCLNGGLAEKRKQHLDTFTELLTKQFRITSLPLFNVNDVSMINPSLAEVVAKLSR